MQLSRLDALRHLSLGALVAFGSSCCFLPPSRSEQNVDVGVLLALASSMEGRDLIGTLPEYEVFASKGIQIDEGKRRRDGILELLESSRSFPGGDHVTVRVAVLRSSEQAILHLGAFCDGWGRGDVTSEDRAGANLCWTPVIEARDDPAGMCMAQGVYYSVAGIERDGLVITFLERGRDAEFVATNEAARELTGRFSR